MRIHHFLIATTILSVACNSGTMDENTKRSITYPPTEKKESTQEYFGVEVKDPYHWLENDTSKATEAWVKAQNEVSFGYLNSIPAREGFRNRLEELWNFPKQSAPIRVGEYYFTYRNDGLQNQSVIYRQNGLEGEASVFLDPNEINPEGTTSISIAGHSKDGKHIAMDRSEAGSDWSTLTVMDVATGETLDDRVEWVKFSGAAWYGDGFYYSRYPAPAGGTEYSATNEDHMVYYHKLGTDQSEDELVYRNPDNPNLYHWVNVTEDEEYLILYVASGTDGYECHYKKLGQDSGFQALFTGFANKSNVVDHIDGRFLVITDIDAPKYRLVSIDPEAPDAGNWKTIVAENEHLLESANTAGGALFLNYLEDACNRLYHADLEGNVVRSIALPGSGSAGGLRGERDDEVLFYSYTSFNYPTTTFRYDVNTGESQVHYRPETDFNPEDFVSKQVKYKSKDGTEVNMFIVHKKGLEMNGMNPTLLYGYGGFNISITPSFRISNIVLLEQGGVYAVANLRGGGEYGEDWHKAGMLLDKQNVFDDFIAAGEYLISEGYTSSDRLAIEGRSNGGLLVGAAMTQRPELFKVAFPGVGVMDMLKYHRFTVGWGWIPEYGCADSSKTHFENLYGYSPYHNLQMGTDYPATMVTTADHDDRVVPAHSFKFAARLQECHSGEDPVIIRIDVDAGHGAGKPTSMVLDELADKWAFMFDNMGLGYTGPS
ncbi:MAG: S9 family peptidase [Flavobacteriales bacterium]|nr:S9 family peptidase [Flavobacteriales bacterium]